MNPKAVKGYNRNWRKLQGRHPANLGAKFRSAGRRYAARPHPQWLGVRTSSGRVVRKRSRGVSPQTAARLKAAGSRYARRQNRRARFLQRERELFNSPAFSYMFRRSLVGRSGRAEDSPLRNPLWNNEGLNLFGSSGQVERANYAAHYDQLWNELKGLYPKGKEPKLIFETGRGDLGHVVTNTPPGHRPVYISPLAYEGARLRPSERAFAGRSDVNLARAVPIHEWVHAFQSPRTLRPGRDRRRRIEGGAEGFTYMVAPKHGLRFTRSRSDPYNRDAFWALRKKGKRWVLSGQFR